MERMKNRLFPVWIILTGILVGCTNSRIPEVDILQIEGVSWACNVNTSYAIFGSEGEEQLEVTLPASDGDLLYMIWEDYQVYHRYNKENGSQLAFTFDTLQTVTANLNGKLTYFELSGPASLDAFKKLTDLEAAQLSCLYLEGPYSKDLLTAIQKQHSSLQGIGIILEDNPDKAYLHDLLTICHPSFLVLYDSDCLPDPEEGKLFSGLELLWIEGNLSTLPKMAPACRKLESLIVASWEPYLGELLSLTGFKNLQNLTIAESDLSSLSSIEFPESLRKLHLVTCETLSDISSITELQNLNAFSLIECSRIEDLDVILKLESLQWLSFPPNISQQKFGDLIEGQTQLQVVELINCSEINDLSPLQTLPELGILALQMEKEQLSMLPSLDQLQLLILPTEIFDDSPEWIKDLKAELPNTKIVAGTGLCLGSGWLLLLIPFILAFRYYFRFKN